MPHYAHHNSWTYKDISPYTPGKRFEKKTVTAHCGQQVRGLFQQADKTNARIGTTSIPKPSGRHAIEERERNGHS